MNNGFVNGATSLQWKNGGVDNLAFEHEGNNISLEERTAIPPSSIPNKKTSQHEFQKQSSLTTTFTTVIPETSNVSKEKQDPAPPDRAQWSNSVEFLLSCIAMSVGIGNFYRFPFVAYQNGGGRFL